MKSQSAYKNSCYLKWAWLFVMLLFNILYLPALARMHKSAATKPQTQSQPKSRSAQRRLLTSNRRHKKLAHKKISPEEIAANKEAQARETEESHFNQNRNTTMSRAYQLYDSGTSEALLGNYKYSVLQLKLSSQLLNEHGEANSALHIATLTALASSAELSGDKQLAKSTYEKLLLMNPQDTSSLLKIARLQASSGDFSGAQTNLNRIFNIKADDQEASLLSHLIIKRSDKPSKTGNFKKDDEIDLDDDD